MAAGVLALAELALQRVGAPVASHVPGNSVARPLAETVGSAGELAAGAVAALVMAAAAGLVLGLRHRPVVAATLAAAALATVAAVATGAATVSNVTVIAAAVVIVGLAVSGAAPLHAAGVGVAGAVVVAGQWALLGGAGTVGAAGLAEAALVAVPLLFAAALVRERRPGPAAWLCAGTGAVLTAAALLTQPGHAALVALWAVGATLALPTPLYVIAAAAVGLVAADWLASPGRRHRAGGLALLIVAGVQPALIHHNLTALVGLVLLALPAGRTGGLDA